MGAGPVGGTLACRLAAAGVSTVVVDRAALPPMENPAFDGRAYAIAAGSRDLLMAAGLWDRLPVPPNPILDIRVSDGRLGRRASRLHLHFDHHDAGEDAGPFGWMVEARSLRMALNGYFPALPALRVFAPATATVERREDGATVHIAGGTGTALPAGGRRRGTRFAVARSGRHPGHPPALRADRHRLRHQPREAAPQRGAGAFSPVRSVRRAADGAERGCRAGRRAERLRHRLDRAHADRGTDAAIGRYAVRRGDCAAAGRPSGRGAHGRAALALSVVGDAGAPLCRYAAGAGRRRGARHPSDRRPGAEPGFPRCDRPGGVGDRGGRERPGPGCAGVAGAATSERVGRTTC